MFFFLSALSVGKVSAPRKSSSFGQVGYRNLMINWFELKV